MSRIVLRLSPVNALTVYVLTIGLASSIILDDMACMAFAGFHPLARQLDLALYLAIAMAVITPSSSHLSPDVYKHGEGVKAMLFVIDEVLSKRRAVIRNARH